MPLLRLVPLKSFHKLFATSADEIINSIKQVHEPVQGSQRGIKLEYLRSQMLLLLLFFGYSSDSLYSSEIKRKVTECTAVTV